MDAEVEFYLKGTDTRALAKKLVMAANPRVSTALLDSSQPRPGYAEDDFAEPAPLVPVEVGPENYIDLDELSDVVSEFVYIVLCTQDCNIDPYIISLSIAAADGSGQALPRTRTWRVPRPTSPS